MKFWGLAGLGGVLIFGLLVPLPSSDQRWVSVAMDLSHYPAFALLTWIVLRIWPTRSSLWIAVVFLGAQIAVEEIQQLIGRSASVQDVVLGFSGTIAALLLQRRPRFLVVGVGLSLLPAIYWGGGNIWDAQQSAHSIPVLSDFSSPFAAGRWETNGMSSRWLAGSWLLEVNDADEAYPGITWRGIPADWSDFSKLRVELEGAGIEGILRLDDQENAAFEDRMHYRLVAEGVQLICELGPDGQVEGHPIPPALKEKALMRMTMFFPEMEVGDRLEIYRIVLLP